MNVITRWWYQKRIVMLSGSIAYAEKKGKDAWSSNDTKAMARWEKLKDDAIAKMDAYELMLLGP